MAEVNGCACRPQRRHDRAAWLAAPRPGRSRSAPGAPGHAHAAPRARPSAGIPPALPAEPSPAPPVRQPLGLHCSQKRLGLRLNGLGQQATCATSQYRRQRIVDRLGLTQGNNSANACHGVSAPSGVQAGFHPPRYAAFLTQPSPILRHSSELIAPDVVDVTQRLKIQSGSRHQPGR